MRNPVSFVVGFLATKPVCQVLPPTSRREWFFNISVVHSKLFFKILTTVVSYGFGVLLTIGYLKAASAAPDPEPVLAISVDQPILRLSDKKEVPTQTKLSVQPLNFPPGAKLVYAWKQIQDEMSPSAAKIAEKPIAFSARDQPSIEATFTGSGVYEIRLTVNDPQSHLSASRNTWINVWDNKPALTVNGQADPLTSIPGMLPPPTVRNLSPDPGPFVHPRLLCTPSDWKEIHDRCVGGQSKLAANAWHMMLKKYDKGVDPHSPDGVLLGQIEAYVESGYTGTPPDLGRGVKPDPVFLVNLADTMAEACFTQWLKNDPSLPHDKVSPEDHAVCLKLAQQLGTLSKFLLDNSWDRKTKQFKTDAVDYIHNLDAIGELCVVCGFDSNYSGLALAYDFNFNWMNADQLRDTRNLLVAVGVGRKGPAQTSRPSVTNRNVSRGFDQNGTFGSSGEGTMLIALVVSGEEASADPVVVDTFLNPPKPADYDKGTGTAYDIVRPVDFDGGGKFLISKPYPESMTWPHSRKATVNALQREIYTYQDMIISPWGFTLERLSYFGYLTNQDWPESLVFARFGGFNQFVGSYYYQSVNNWIFVQYPSAAEDKSYSFTSHLGMYEHHTGGGDYRQQHILFLKYMYPDDPLVDYAYATQAPDIERRPRNLINTCVFALDPGIKDLHEALEPIAKAKELPLTKLDPELGIVCMRSGWKDSDQMLYLDAGYNFWGHMNAEHGSFSFFALGRHWSVPSGYHKVLSNFQTLIQSQNPAWAACPVTQGFMAENPAYTPLVPNCDYNGGFPTPFSHLLEVKESPDQLWSSAACDITSSYNFTCGTPKAKQVTLQSLIQTDYMYPGLLSYLGSLDAEYSKPRAHSFLPVPDGDQIEYAIRTVLFVRGARPYALIVDDFRKSDSASNYRWMMNDKIKTSDENAAESKDDSFCVELARGATSTEGTLLHRRDEGSQPGLARLLLRDLSENDNSHQPTIQMVHTIFKLDEAKYSSEDSNSLLITRTQVVNPNYKILLFPYRTGEEVPATTWNDKKTELKIDLKNGSIDTITFDRANSDHRTRISFERINSAP